MSFNNPPNPGSIDYNPVNFFPSTATRQFWLDFNDTANLLDGSGNPVTNGVAIATMKDTLSAATIFAQATAGQRGTWNSAVQNSRGAVTFTSGGSTNYAKATPDMIKNSNAGTLLAVIFPTATGTNYVFRSSDAAGVNNRFMAKFINSGINPCLLGNSGDLTEVSINSAIALASSTWNAVIWEFDVLNGTGSIWVNGRRTSIFNNFAFTAGTWPNTNATGNVLGIGGSSSWKLADLSLFTGDLMTDTAKLQWFASVKNRFALTTY